MCVQDAWYLRELRGNERETFDDVTDGAGVGGRGRGCLRRRQAEDKRCKDGEERDAAREAEATRFQGSGRTLMLR